jgi:tetratricopeptide (TPR) repeat protein
MSSELEVKTDRVEWRNWGWLGYAAIAIAALGGVIAMQRSQLETAAGRSQTPQVAQQRQAARLQTLKQIPSLTFDNFLADWTFLSFLQYFGDDQARSQTDYSLNDDYFDAITQLDPHFIQMYPFLSTAISYYQGRPEVAIEYMNRGIAALSPQVDPNAYLVWYYKALDQWLLLGNTEAAARSFENAADWLEAARAVKTAGRFRQTAQFLRQNPDSLRLRIWGWNQVYQQTVDDRVRERAKRELLKLGAEIRKTESGRIQFVVPQDRSQSQR